MHDLLKIAIDAHGGQERWKALRTVSLDLSIGGALWDLKGQTGLFDRATYEADLHQQRATLGHFGGPDRRIRFTPDRRILETNTGDLIGTRDRPRDAFAGHVNETPWDEFHSAYFSGVDRSRLPVWSRGRLDGPRQFWRGQNIADRSRFISRCQEGNTTIRKVEIDRWRWSWRPSKRPSDNRIWPSSRKRPRLHRPSPNWSAQFKEFWEGQS